MNQELKQKLGLAGNSNNNKRLVLNEVTLDGEEGKFILKRLAEERGEDGRFKQSVIEKQSLQGVILATRRKLQYYSDTEGKVYSTLEFQRNDEQTTYFGEHGTEKATATELREKYPQLRTLAVVYVLMGEKLVRVNCKGLGLQNEEQGDKLGLFQYLSSFSENEAPFEFYTEFSATPKEVTKGRKTKTYYAMRFERKAKLPEDKQHEIDAHIEKILAQFDNQVEKAEPQAVDEYTEYLKTQNGVAYPQDDINPEDIPF